MFFHIASLCCVFYCVRGNRISRKKCAHFVILLEKVLFTCCCLIMAYKILIYINCMCFVLVFSDLDPHFPSPFSSNLVSHFGDRQAYRETPSTIKGLYFTLSTTQLCLYPAPGRTWIWAEPPRLWPPDMSSRRVMQRSYSGDGRSALDNGDDVSGGGGSNWQPVSRGYLSNVRPESR